MAEVKAAPKFLLDLMLAALKANAGDVAVEISEYIEEKYAGTEEIAKVRKLIKMPTIKKETDLEEEQVLSDTFFAAISRDYHEAANVLSELGAEGKTITRQAEKLAMAGFTIEHAAIHSKGEKEVYHDLRIIFCTGAAVAESVRLQYYFLTDKDTVFTGYEELTGIEPLSTYRSATAVSAEMLGKEEIANARIELYLHGELVH
jgi:hypothetical protein